MTCFVPKFQLGYISAPKCACSSLKYVFFELENSRVFEPFTVNGVEKHIHNVYPSVPFNNEKYSAYNYFKKLCIVREPIKRFLSAYSNRVVFHRELRAEALSEEAKDAGAKPDPSLDEFISKLGIYRKFSWSIQHHTNPLTTYLGEEASFYDSVFDISELDEVRSMISDVTGINIKMPRLQSGGPKLKPDEISKTDIKNLMKFYSDDYTAFSNYFK